MCVHMHEYLHLILETVSLLVAYGNKVIRFLLFIKNNIELYNTNEISKFQSVEC